MLELIKRAWRREVMAGKHPTKICMTQKMYDELEVEAAQRFYARSMPMKDYTEVFGMRIEVRDDLDNGVMFQIS